MDPTVFYLTTAGEFQAISEPRVCSVIARACDDHRDDYLVVKISPEVVSMRIGSAEPIQYLLLSSRFNGTSLCPINEWPMHVYVTRILDPTLVSGGRFQTAQVEPLAWGILYPNIDAAKAFAERYI